MSSMRNGLASIHRFRDVNQFRKYFAEWRIVRPTEREVEFAVERIEPVIHRLSQRIGLINSVRGTDFILRFLHCGESAGGKKRENCGAEASDAGTWHEDGTAKNVCVDLVENRIFLRNTAGVDDAANGDAVLGHAIENDASVEGSTFDGGEKFVLCGGLQIPAERDAAQIGIDEDRAIAVVPGHAKQTSLSGAIGI